MKSKSKKRKTMMNSEEYDNNHKKLKTKKKQSKYALDIVSKKSKSKNLTDVIKTCTSSSSMMNSEEDNNKSKKLKTKKNQSKYVLDTVSKRSKSKNVSDVIETCFPSSSLNGKNSNNKSESRIKSKSISTRTTKENKFCSSYLSPNITPTISESNSSISINFNKTEDANLCNESERDFIFSSFMDSFEVVDDEISSDDLSELLNDEEAKSSYRSSSVLCKRFEDSGSISSSDEISCNETLSGGTECKSEIESSELGNAFKQEQETLTLESLELDHEENYEIFQSSHGYVVILKEFGKTNIFGLAYLKVLYGKIDILGTILSRDSQKTSVYSPRGLALLQIKNITNGNCTFSKLSVVVPELANEEFADTMISTNSAILTLSILEDFKITFIEKYISQKILPEPVKSMPRAVINPPGTWNSINIPDNWNEIMNTVKHYSRLMVCGGKGLGKSTFIRFAINSLLQKFGQVRVIDLDPGQSEFTVPGTISILTVTEPVIGPNYTHLQKTEKSMLSSIDTGNEPDRYISNVCALMNYEASNTETEVPTVINCMGYVNDLGLPITAASILFVRPTIVLQIESKSRFKNYSCKLTLENVTPAASMLSDNLPNCPEYEVLTIPSATDSNEGWSLLSRQTRDMSILSYFGQTMTHEIRSLLDCRVPMYEMDFADIKITDYKGIEVPRSTANANLVALCAADGEMNGSLSFQCFGWGVVRDIDEINNFFVLITPLEKEILEKVYYLVVGCLNLPPSVYMTTDDVRGPIPYVMVSDLVGFAQTSNRSYLPPGKK